LDIVSDKKIAIVDVNNFYVSCERLFQPSFKKKATVVLSNNDGCVIARSQESKDLGIKMGQPLFQLDDEVKEKISKFSSNYALYGDISDRIINILKREVPTIEVYSIDEAFLDLTHIPEHNLLTELTRLKQLIAKLVGVPVSIAVAPNKTLAKLCNHLAKKNESMNGACSYWDVKETIQNIDIGEVWGIGSKYNNKLNQAGISTVTNFKTMDPGVIRNLMHSPGVKTFLELHEVLCYPLVTKFKKPKMITTSRTFGSTVWEPDQLLNAVWQFTRNCHRKMVKENLTVNACSIFATTNKFDDNYFVFTYQFKLKWQTDDLQTIWNQIAPIIKSMPVRLYYKAGVCFYNLKNKNCKQELLFDEIVDFHEIPYVEDCKWDTRRDFLTPQYTTSWKDIPVLK
jgi:DNA polymerase V